MLNPIFVFLVLCCGVILWLVVIFANVIFRGVVKTICPDIDSKIDKVKEYLENDCEVKDKESKKNED